MKYRPDIDGLRAVAVTSAVLYHAFPALTPGGFVGVDVFFVISGYLITSILLDDLEKRRFSILRFYNRRVRRIFPAVFLVLAATLALGWALLFRSEFWSLGAHLAASALFVENYLLWSEMGYFDAEAMTKPLLHLWSLAIEEQFYVVWPILLWALTRLRISVLFAIFVLAVGSLWTSVHDVSANPSAAYYSPLSRSWELMLGAGLAYVHMHKPQLLARFKTLQSGVGAALLVASLFVINGARPFPGFWALAPTVGTLLLISAGPEPLINRRILSIRPLVFVGLVSYPFYLWHWPIFSFAYIVHGPSSPLQMTAFIVLAFALAVLTYLLVEKRFRFGGQGALKPTMLAGAMAVVLAAGASASSLRVPPRLFRFDDPTRTGFESFTHGRDFYRYEDDRPRLALFVGDSHVAQYAERVSATVSADRDRFGAIFAVGGGCIPIESVFTPEQGSQPCWALREAGLAMAEEDRIERVLIGGSWNWYFLDSKYEYRADGASLPLVTDAGREAALDQLERQIEDLAASGKEVFLLLGNPVSWRYSPFTAGSRLHDAASIIDDFESRRVELQPEAAALREDLRALANRSGAVVIDPFLVLCDDLTCRVAEDGLPIFRDSSHFNPDWAMQRATFIDPVTAAALTPSRSERSS